MENFKDWLINVKQYKESTADSYTWRINHIYNKVRLSNIKAVRTTSNIDQQWLSKYVIPILTGYYEFSNKEYYLDRITISYAQDYLKQVANYIHKNTPLLPWLTAKLYIFDGKEDYYVCDTSINQLSADLKMLNIYLYEYHTDIDEEVDSAIDLMKLMNYRKL